ncbi:MAG: TIGR01244 family sulfur transferase [Parvularcula sp.]
MFGPARLTDDYSISPQPRPADLQAFAKQGFTRIICNRPDGEALGQPTIAEMQKAAAAAGLFFVALPFGMPGPSAEMIDTLRTLLHTPGKTLAYCASGQRSALLFGTALIRDGKSMEDVLRLLSKVDVGDLDLVEARIFAWAQR